jgi:hypothetical protein
MIYYFKMTKYFLILIVIAFSISISTAQVNRTLQLTGYNNNVSILIKDKNAMFISKGDTTKVALVAKNNLLNISADDEIKASKVLAFSEKNIETVSKKYADAYLGLSYPEKLINKAKDLGGSMVITKEVNAITNEDTVTNTPPVGNEEDEVPMQNLETKNDSNLMSYLWIPFAILSSILAVLWFTKKDKNVNKKPETPHQGENPKTNEVFEQQIQQLQAKVQELNTQLQQANTKDNKYYAAVLHNFLLPAKQALESGNEAKATELMVASLYHSISKANEQQGNRSQSDVANMQALENGSTPNAKSITKDTNADAIQKEIQNVIAYLQKNGAKELPNTIVLDHSITNL